MLPRSKLVYHHLYWKLVALDGGNARHTPLLSTADERLTFNYARAILCIISPHRKPITTLLQVHAFMCGQENYIAASSPCAVILIYAATRWRLASKKQYGESI